MDSKSDGHCERERVSWPVRLWLSDTLCLAGRTVETCAHGLCVMLLSWLPSDIFTDGATFRLEVRCGGGRVWCTPAVSRISPRGIELTLKQPFRVALTSDGRNGCGNPAEALPALAAAVLAALRSMSDLTRASIGEGLETLVRAAVHQAAHENWKVVRGLLGDLSTLVRVAVRLDEIPREECQAMTSAVSAARETLWLMGQLSPERG